MANANLAGEETTSNMDTSVDIKRLITSMTKKVDNLSTLSPKCCIFRVPKRLQQVNERAYTPIRVSIGSLHHGKNDLKPMEEHKWRYLKDFLLHSQKSLEDLVKFIKEREESIRECYEETIIFNSDKFVEIILVDAAFIIEVLLKYMYSGLINSSDRIFEKPMMILDIFQDFLLLENQLPFFVLEDLFEMLVFETSTFIVLATNFLARSDILHDKIPNDIASTRVKHFVDLVRSFLTQRECSPPYKWRNEPVKSPTAKELHNAGIKFEAISNKNLLDIKFMNGVMVIPKLVIDDETEGLLRNLLAFERCLYEECYMTQYMWFLDELIDSSNDVEYLVESGVIENLLGDNNDASNLINKLGVELYLDRENFYLSKLCEELNDYCNIPWHKWEATLRRDYFKTPWGVISIVAVAILLSLTFIQAVCSILSISK
ncbi:transmembrane protein, putative [Actinidia rufa]|uniref:Transmembrane protein, putative n=1 Tax=Actinidia rufa TaxID=165716 RepID=A0A7J0DPV7_9ERIC|nr:transmembrane protein, putative [Actinidia rufa]